MIEIIEVGVDGLGMTVEEAAEHVAAGRMPLGPPLGVYCDAETFERYKKALERESKHGHPSNGSASVSKRDAR